jgi:ribose/xylose/arabinose/galactoside ABC-type transport system permease subunit
MGAVMCMGMHTYSGHGWFFSIMVALVIGVAVGLINGILVSKGKIHSFVATLGMQFVLKGAMYIYCGGAMIGDKGDYAFADFMNMKVGFLPFSPKIIVVLVIVIAIALLMKHTRWGRNIYMVGGNPEAAWLAGIKSDRTVISGFVIAAVACAFAGCIFAICQSSAVPNMGDKGISPLLIALAATIIGGTATSGGKGTVWNTYVAVYALMVIANVLMSIFGKFEVQILVDGLVLALCVVYETIIAYQRSKRLGIRSQLLEELSLQTPQSYV